MEFSKNRDRISKLSNPKSLNLPQLYVKMVAVAKDSGDFRKKI